MVRNPFGKDKKESFRHDDQMKAYGIYVHTGKQLELRLKKIDQLSEEVHRTLMGNTSIAKVQDLIRKMKAVDKLLRQASMAWTRAGTDSRYRRAVNGYERLFRMVLRDCIIVESDLEGKEDVEQGDMARHLELWVNMLYFENALFLTDASYFDKDVTPTLDRTDVIHTQPIPGFGFGSGTVAATSGGRTSEESLLPEQKTYPAQMDNRVVEKKEEEAE